MESGKLCVPVGFGWTLRVVLKERESEVPGALQGPTSRFEGQRKVSPRNKAIFKTAVNQDQDS